MTAHNKVPELLAPAGSLDAVRAAVANGADSVYLGAEKFNARDEGAQLSFCELETACAIAHARAVRVYLTLNTLVKPAELNDALAFLGDAIDRGVDAAIVQDIGLVRLIRAVYPGFEIHGSTQMTVHDASGARLMHELGVDRVVLARENTIEDIRAISDAVPELGLETFIHGALCISYSGQCYMSGMISERSANRGSCAQSCRKDYTLTDSDTGQLLDSGFLISAKDLAAHDSLADIADAGVACLKIEGRKKRPEYVATVTQAYREFRSRVSEGDRAPPSATDIEPLVQIFSRGFTPGMYRGRAGRDYVTRDHPDNRGLVVGTVVELAGREVVVDAAPALQAGDGVAFEVPGERSATTGATVTAVRTISERNGRARQALTVRAHPLLGATVVRSSDAQLLAGARNSFQSVELPDSRRIALDVAAFGSSGSPLKLVFRSPFGSVTVHSETPLVPASRRALNAGQLRDQLGRLGETAFALRDVESHGLAAGLFIPVSELNHMRQSAVADLAQRAEWCRIETTAERARRISEAVESVPADTTRGLGSVLSAHVYNIDDGYAALAARADEIVFDPFLRHPMPPVARVRALAEEAQRNGATLRIRTPTIVRPAERRLLDKWLALDLPLVCGHVGLVAELARGRRDVVADYAVNCFNQHTASELFRLGASRIVPSIELTTEELSQLVSPWNGSGFDVMIYGRPEGMTIEHCVLSAAYDRVPTTCRDLCVRQHPNVTVTDPSGYSFAAATDSACRNRLLHSRPVEGSEFMPRLWQSGIRSFHAIFNVPGDDIPAIVGGYRAIIDSLASGARDTAAKHRTAGSVRAVRNVVGSSFTRGHFARAV